MENIETEVTPVVKRGRGRPKIHTDVPSHLTCCVTGRKVKTTPIQFRKQLCKSNLTAQEFMDTYVSRSGRKQITELKKAKLKAKKETANFEGPTEPPAVLNDPPVIVSKPEEVVPF